MISMYIVPFAKATHDLLNEIRYCKHIVLINAFSSFLRVCFKIRQLLKYHLIDVTIRQLLVVKPI